MTIIDLEAELLSLDVETRARLAERLLRSLDEISREEAETLWLAELERREREVEEGRMELVPAEEVYARVRRRLE